MVPLPREFSKPFLSEGQGSVEGKCLHFTRVSCAWGKEGFPSGAVLVAENTLVCSRTVLILTMKVSFP